LLPPRPCAGSLYLKDRPGCANSSLICSLRYVLAVSGPHLDTSNAMANPRAGHLSCNLMGGAGHWHLSGTGGGGRVAEIHDPAAVGVRPGERELGCRAAAGEQPLAGAERQRVDEPARLIGAARPGK